MTIAKKVLAEYKIGRTVGEGAFSKVKLGIHRVTNEKVAVKIISKKRLEASYKKKERDRREREKRAEKKKQEKLKKEQELIKQGKVPNAPPPPTPLTQEEKRQLKVDKERAAEKEQELLDHMPGQFSKNLSREVRLLQSLHHPNIIRLYQVVETEQEYYIITEYAAGGEVIDYIAKQEHLTEKEARRFFREIVSAIDHCHLSGVLHRDLKLENILLSSERHILITDFGLGRSYQAENLCNTFCGTPLYAAPELVSGIKYFGPPADIWAMGVVLFAMIAGKPPFQADTMSDLYKRIKAVDYKFPEWVSPEFKDLIGKIFTKDTSERITMDEIRNHPWVVGEYGTPPLRLEPTGPVLQLNSSESQVEHLKAIAYEQNALMYSFNEVTSSRDIHRPRKDAIGPVGSFDDRKSHSDDSGLDTHGVRLVVPRPKDEPTLDREELEKKAASAVVSPQPAYINDLDGHLAQMATYLNLINAPAAPTKAALSKRESTELECEYVRTFSLPFKRSHPSMSGLHHAPVPANMQPKAPDSSIQRRSIVTDELINPTSVPYALMNAANLAAAASAVAKQPAKQRRASMASLRANSSERIASRGGSEVMTRSGQNSPRPGSSTLHTTTSEQSLAEPRSVRGLFTLAATSPTFTPDELVAEVHRVLMMLNLHYNQVSKYLTAVAYSSSHERVEIEIEIVKVWLLSTHGIQIRRKSGSTWLYKQLYSSIANALSVD